MDMKAIGQEQVLASIIVERDGFVIQLEEQLRVATQMGTALKNANEKLMKEKSALAKENEELRERLKTPDEKAELLDSVEIDTVPEA